MASENAGPWKREIPIGLEAIIFGVSSILSGEFFAEKGGLSFYPVILRILPFRPFFFGNSMSTRRHKKSWRKTIWLVVSTHLKNISQIGNLPRIGLKIKTIWNHHLAIFQSSTYASLRSPATQGLRQLGQWLIVRVETRGTPWNGGGDGKRQYGELIGSSSLKDELRW